jgi:hypothetical protein
MIINITNATIIKSITLVKKSPYKIATSPVTFPVASATPSVTTYFKSLKSALKTKPISGETIPPVNEVTTCLKAAPITKPTAMSTKFPFTAKSLNSLSIPMFY